MVLTSKDISVVKYLSRKYAEDTVKGLGILFGIHIIGTILLIMMSSSEEIPSIALGFWSNFPLAVYLMGALFIISATNYEIFAFLNQNGISRKTLWKNKMIVLGLGTLILVLIGTIYDAMVSSSGTNDLIAITYLKGTNPVVKAIGSYLFDVLVTFMTVTWISSIGAALSSFLVSYLVTISWHAAFAIYLLVIPALILFTLFVPLKKQPVVASQHESRPKQSINSKVILIAGLMFAIFAFYMPMAYELPSLIVSQQMGTASTAALIAGLSTLIGIPIGASFGFFFKRLHDKIFPLGFILVTLGFLITALSPNIAILFGGVIVLGFGFGLGVPYMYNWLDWSAPANSVNLATTIVLVLVNVGCALSPSLLALIATPLGLNHPRGIMLISTCAFLVIAIYATIHYLGVHKANVAKETVHSKEPHNAH